MSALPLLGPAASALAPRTDRLFTFMVLLCGFVALGVFTVILVFSIRYREGSRVARGNIGRHRGIEATWIVAPLVIFLGIFFWAAFGFGQLYRPPADAVPIYVVAKQWMWKLQHRTGRREINELHVPLGEPVRLVMTSQDAIHSFFVPAFRIKQDLVPGRYTSISFTATRLGVYQLFCAEYCGSEHSRMLGRIVVMTPADYARWLASGPAHPSLAQYGFVRFRQLGCSGCHSPQSSVHAPMLDGLIGRTVHLQDGRSLVADDTYVRDSILLPRKDIVAGYAPIMPSFAGQVSEEDIEALIAYLRSTSAPGTPGAAR